MLYHIIAAVVGVLVLFGAWIVVQGLARRHMNMPAGTDVLVCSLCGANGTCSCGLREAMSQAAARSKTPVVREGTKR